MLISQPESQIALRGSNITLTCEAASSEAVMTAVWKRNNILLPSSLVTNKESVGGNNNKEAETEADDNDETDVKVEGEVEEEEGETTEATTMVRLVTTLHISEVTDEDSGLYQCIISNNLGTTYSNKANIAVHG